VRHRDNPAWVNNLLGGYCDSLRAAAKRLGLPMPLLHEDKTCAPESELGCGVFGCALRSASRGIVFKVTREETEAHFAAAYMELARRGVKPEGMVEYYGVLAAGPKRFFLWREEVDFVGAWWEGIAPKYFGHDKNIDLRVKVANRALNILWNATDDIFAAAQLARRQMTENDYWRWMERNVEASNVSRPRTSSDYKRGLTLAQYLSDTRRRIDVLMRHGPALLPLWETWLEYEKHGVVIGDTHVGNVGIRRDTGGPVFTDPGAVTILSRELSALPVEAIRP